MRAGTRSAWFPTIVLAISTLLATAWQISRSRGISINSGCGFDGAYYCKMFHGGAGYEPYGRRILAPRLAALIANSPLIAFRILDALAILGIILLILKLVGVSRDIEYSSPVERWVPAVLVVSVALSSRNLLHFTLSYPVITDPLALFLLLLSLYGILRMGTSRWFLILAVTGGFMAPLARENYGIPIAAGVLVALRVRHVGRMQSITTSFASLFGTFIAFNQVQSSSSPGIASVMWGWITEDFLSAQGLTRFTSMLAIGIGFFWLPLLSRAFFSKMQSTDWPILAVTFAFAAISTFGGGDTDRILMPVGILLCILSARVASRNPKFQSSLAFLSLSYFIAQDPFQVTGSATSDWISFFALRVAQAQDLLLNGIVPVILSVPMLLWAIRNFRLSSRNAPGVLPEGSVHPYL